MPAMGRIPKKPTPISARGTEHRENPLNRYGCANILGIFRLRRRVRAGCAQDDTIWMASLRRSISRRHSPRSQRRGAEGCLWTCGTGTLACPPLPLERCFCTRRNACATWSIRRRVKQHPRIRDSIATLHCAGL